MCAYVCRFKEAWSYAAALEVASCWNELAQAALYHLDIELGIRKNFQVARINF